MLVLLLLNLPGQAQANVNYMGQDNAELTMIVVPCLHEVGALLGIL